ncbi:hypothetical protein BJ944DRAFT_163827 [Cunninghamella echinulata]|nr:hypothetical protein BJ944DRAFT_163827 [Cunninghamella echinulata]
MTGEISTPLSQRSFRIRKSLRDLANKPRIHKRKQSLPLPSLPSHLNDKDDYTYDILYECQRGLLQFDPNQWCDAYMKYTPMTPATYQLPDPTWEWVIYILKIYFLFVFYIFLTLYKSIFIY